MTTLLAADGAAIGDADPFIRAFANASSENGFDKGHIERRMAQHATLRRCLDVVGAILLLVPAVPVLVLAALAVLIEDRGPWLYRQQRVGRHGRTFTLLKVRTMRVDAESDGRARWACIHDDRITRVGRWLRLTRVDELPQLFNVLAGQMSLIGPRPERPCFVEEIARDLPCYRLRHLALPGITGYAQVHGGYTASHHEARAKLAYDLHYLAHRSFALDLAIATRTVLVVLTGRGAR